MMDAKVCLCLLLTCLVGFKDVTARTLYSSADDVTELDISNFDSTITRSATTWVVEFYSAWCGHCQRFAPIYKQYATKVKGWSNVVRIGAVACSDPQNMPICRTQDVRTFPLVKFFPANLQRVTSGFKFSSLQFNADKLVTDTVSFLNNYMTASDRFPSLQRHSTMTALQDQAKRFGTHDLYAIVETTDNQLAKMVILGLSSQYPRVMVGRLTKSALPNPSLLWQPLPSLISVDIHGNNIRFVSQLESVHETIETVQTMSSGPQIPSHTRPAHNSPSISTSTHPSHTNSNHNPHNHGSSHDTPQQRQSRLHPSRFHKHIDRPAPPHPTQQYVTTERRTLPRQTLPPTRPTTTLRKSTTRYSQQYTTNSHITSDSQPHEDDLDSNLYYSFWNEVPARSRIRGKALPALKEYVEVLNKYHPGSERLRTYIGLVHKWLQRIGGSLDSTLYLNTMDGLQTDNSYVEKDLKWHTCLGSEERYGGYPCSLWMTFHALTVEAYEDHIKHPTRPFDPLDVLEAIRNYIKYFFSCQDCSEHFLEMSKRMTHEVNEPEDVILWLWKAHNKVNNRLHGDLTEDPTRPKQQFPGVAACPSCRYTNFDIQQRFDNDTLWNEDEVLSYLRQYYSVSSVKDVKKEISQDPDNLHKTTTGWPTQPTETPTTSTCTHMYSPWSDCSVTCGNGVSTRLSNANNECKMQMEMRICRTRPCEYNFQHLVQNLTPRVCSVYAANIQEERPKPLQFNNCITTKAYRWRYCGLCEGYCCEPTTERTFWTEVTCDGQFRGQVQLAWIDMCSCKPC